MHRADQMGLGSLLGRTTGEVFAMSFAGQGFVVVQPSEELPARLMSGTGGGTGRSRRWPPRRPARPVTLFVGPGGPAGVAGPPVLAISCSSSSTGC